MSSEKPKIEMHKFDPWLSPEPAHRHQNGGGWVSEKADVSDRAFVGPMAMVERGVMYGGEMHGGVMCGGVMYGGEMHGGAMCGGEMRGGVMWDGVMRGGVMWGGEMWGGEMWGGVMHGGEMHGGVMRGGVMRGGEMHGGVMHGGEMHGGEMHGGEIWGGEMWGGVMHGGVIKDGDRIDRTPIQGMCGRWYFIFIAHKNELRIGCQHHGLAHWKKHINKIIEEDGATKEEALIAKSTIDLCAKAKKLEAVK